MNLTYEVIVSGALLVLLIVLAGLVQKRRPHRLNSGYFMARWIELQKFCSDKATWPLAVIDADKLLDEALKRRHFKGKTMGERLVSAQHSLTNNDSVWYGHKLRNQLVHESAVKLKKSDVMDALAGIRQALRDVGALK